MKTYNYQVSPITENFSSANNGLTLKTYKTFGSGVHQAVEDFKTKAEAKQHLKGRDTEHVGKIQLLTGQDREEYRDLGYLIW